MSRKQMVGGFLIASILIVLALQVNVVFAQEPVHENDENCVSCHTHRYYLYDEGKWFCLCKAPMHCVYCHNGRTDTLVKELAHEGLVLYATHQNAARCRTCHTEDYASRLLAFSMVAGLKPTQELPATPTSVASAGIILEPPASPPLLRFSQLEPWRLVGLGILGVAFIGMILLGYRCWKADCLAKLEQIKSI